MVHAIQMYNYNNMGMFVEALNKIPSVIKNAENQKDQELHFCFSVASNAKYNQDEADANINSFVEIFKHEQRFPPK